MASFNHSRKFSRKPDPLSFWFFLCLLFPAWGIRAKLFWREPLWDERIFKGLSLGLAYDVMNAAAFAFVVAILPVPCRIQKLAAGLCGIVVLCFYFMDYHYVLQFGTHLPFSTVEYLLEPRHFSSTLEDLILQPSFFFVLLLPIALLICGLNRTVRYDSMRQLLNQRGIALFLFLIIGGTCGSYSNSYVAKNLEDPLVSAGLNYFFWTHDREEEAWVERPDHALSLVSDSLKGKVPQETVFKEYPLVRDHLQSSCLSPSTTLAKVLCRAVSGKPNILILLLESFRAAEIGVLGSSLQLTPRFDEWSGRGILFTRFYANGFQTRHGEVAVYCSLMPNYGVAIMKRYARSSFRCLPEVLQEQGYDTSWLNASDSSFDGQADFLKSNGFARIIDRFDFTGDDDELGWGFSDQALYRKLLEELKSLPEPFLSSALTITNHHPFDVPQAYKLGLGNDVLHRYYNAIHYTDAQLGAFLDAAAREEWYADTLILVTADTSNYQLPQSPPENFEEFVKIRTRIPLLITGGLVRKSLIINDYASQIDLAPTLMDLIGEMWKAPWAGQSMLSDNWNPVAYTNRPGAYWAVMKADNRYYRENDRLDHAFGNSAPKGFTKNKAIGEAWIKTTHWLLQENRYWPSQP